MHIDEFSRSLAMPILQHLKVIKVKTGLSMLTVVSTMKRDSPETDLSDSEGKAMTAAFGGFNLYLCIFSAQDVGHIVDGHSVVILKRALSSD